MKIERVAEETSNTRQNLYDILSTLRLAGQTAHLPLPILFTWRNGCACDIISIITGLYSLLGSVLQPKQKVKDLIKVF